MEQLKEFQNINEAYKLFCFQIDAFVDYLKDFKKKELKEIKKRF